MDGVFAQHLLYPFEFLPQHTEPTSGLDSFQAQSVVSALKTLAEEGRTIVTVIHQPRSSIFQVGTNLGCTCGTLSSR